MAHDQALAGNMVGTCVGIHLAHYCCMEGITLGKNSVVFLKITIPIGPPTPWISHHWLSPLLCFFYLKPPVFIFLLKSQAFLCINLEPGSQGDISHWFPSLKLFFPKPFNFPLSSLPVPSNTLFFPFRSYYLPVSVFLILEIEFCCYSTLFPRILLFTDLMALALFNIAPCFCFLFVHLFWDRVLPCSSGWLWTM